MCPFRVKDHRCDIKETFHVLARQLCRFKVLQCCIDNPFLFCRSHIVLRRCLYVSLAGLDLYKMYSIRIG